MVYVKLDVSEYTAGNDGFWMYVLFIDTVVPDPEEDPIVNKQHTPKPEAQFPEALPPFSSHSVDV